ncbi:hypothetical protein Pla52n_26910 [Stieleria varia]|uniref:Uncharacterized protein n=1 Tax=Stieleria varia TaxID=2528005 RepID=A0A5C6AZP3_9BACT|nr:hypothetical protein Pla52n_26910 [Stieleria varia]
MASSLSKSECLLHSFDTYSPQLDFCNAEQSDARRVAESWLLKWRIARGDRVIRAVTRQD